MINSGREWDWMDDKNKTKMNKGPKGELRLISINALGSRQKYDQYLDRDGNVWIHNRDCGCCKGPVLSEVVSNHSALTRGRQAMQYTQGIDPYDNTLFCHICIPILNKVRTIRKLTLVE